MTEKEKISGWNIDTLKEHLTALINSNDRRYQESFATSKEAVAAALAAQKELTNAAFASSEKAIVKAEEAQRDYNVRSNEFRGQLDDQAQTLMPRTETNVLMQGVNEKVTDHAKVIEILSGRITAIESRGDGKSQMWQYVIAAFGIISIIAGLITFILSFKK